VQISMWSGKHTSWARRHLIDYISEQSDALIDLENGYIDALLDTYKHEWRLSAP